MTQWLLDAAPAVDLADWALTVVTLGERGCSIWPTSGRRRGDGRPRLHGRVVADGWGRDPALTTAPAGATLLVTSSTGVATRPPCRTTPSSRDATWPAQPLSPGHWRAPVHRRAGTPGYYWAGVESVEAVHWPVARPNHLSHSADLRRESR